MNSDKKGFTVVELIIVVVIIVILATVTAFAFGSWRSRTARTEVRNDLSQGAAAIKDYKHFNNDLPASQSVFNARYKSTSAVTLTYIKRTDNTFCLNGVSTQDSTVKFYVDSRSNDSQVVQGQCS